MLHEGSVENHSSEEHHEQDSEGECTHAQFSGARRVYARENRTHLHNTFQVLNMCFIKLSNGKWIKEETLLAAVQSIVTNQRRILNVEDTLESRREATKSRKKLR